MYRLFLALRYLRSRGASWLALLAVALSVGILVVVNGVMSGFQDEIRERIRGFDSHLSADCLRPFGLTRTADLDALVREVPHVTATSPYIESIMLVRAIPGGDITDLGYVKGIDPARETETSDFARFLLSPRAIEEEFLRRSLHLTRAESWQEAYHARFIRAGLSREEADRRIRKREAELAALPDEVDAAGIFENARQETPFPPLVVGIEFLEWFRLDVGSTVRCITSSDVAELKRSQEQIFEVVGVFKTGVFDTDRRFAYARLDDARRFILGTAPDAPAPDRATGIAIRVDDWTHAPEVKRLVEARIDRALAATVGEAPAGWSDVRVFTWAEKKKSLMDAVDLEKRLLGFILFFMVLLAGLLIAIILRMLAVEKIRDTGVLKSLGATGLGAASIFLLQGLFIGLLGSVAGLGLGLGFLARINEIALRVKQLTGYHPFPPNVYYLDEIPSRIVADELAVIIVPTIVVSILAAFFAAWLAARVDPVEALRYE